MSALKKGALGLLVLGLLAVLAAPDAFAEKLPVFKLKAPKVDKAKGRDLFVKNMGGAPTVEEKGNATVHKSGNKFLEIDNRSGHIFMGDMEKMWNPKAKANVPDEARVKDIAEKFLNDNKLKPEKGQQGRSVEFKLSHMSESRGGDDFPGQDRSELLDRQANYQAEITVRGQGGQERTIPVIGGGGKMQVSVGDRGSVIGFHGGWREIESTKAEVEILDQAGAEAQFKQKFRGLNIKNTKSRLAYYAAPGFEEQEVMAPVWIVSAEVEVGGETVPARDHIIPATEHGPFMEEGPPAKKRGGNEPNPPGHDDGDEAGPGGKRSWLDLPGHIADALFPPAYADSNECGTEWIGTSQGLGGSAGNKQGFVDHCRAAGWTINFDWGDQWAWEKDWRVNDDYYVDGADLVFYTGHANQNGWVLNSPDDTFMHYNEVGGALDIYGQNDLEWLIIAACGPLQSTHFTTNTTNAFDRWRNIFDGLHVFLGYGAVTYDNTSEGRRFMELSRAGWNVIDAWFRTAQEIQPGTNGYSAPNGPYIKVVAMYAHNGDHCARNDHLWGMGSGCADVTGSGQQRYMMWSGT